MCVCVCVCVLEVGKKIKKKCWTTVWFGACYNNDSNEFLYRIYNTDKKILFFS
jgi:hypothetical protein